jgi:hypothetical protein
MSVSDGGGEAFERARRELAGARPEEFTLVRVRLENDLKAAGETEAAAAIHRRRRPPLSVWACNQVALETPEVIEDILTATAEVGAAQDAALAGDDADALRETARARQDGLRAATDAAAAVLRDAGVKPAAHVDDIAATFDAATLSEESADALRAGDLTRPLRAPSGLGAMPTSFRPAEGNRTPAASGAKAKSAARGPSREERRARERAQKDLDRTRGAQEAAATAVEERLAELASARLHAESVKAHRQDVERALAQSRTEETAAGEAVASAAAAAEDARRDLGRAEQDVVRAERALPQS